MESCCQLEANFQILGNSGGGRKCWRKSNLILAYIDHSCNVSLATRIHYVLCRSLKYDLSYPVFFLAAPNYPNIIVCIKENRKNTK